MNIRYAPPFMTRRSLLRMLAATPLFGACGGPTVLGQIDPHPVSPEGLPGELPAPDLQVGDEWRYIVRAELTGLTTDHTWLRVSAAVASGYRIAVQSDAGPSETQYDRNLNHMVNQGVAFEPPYPRFMFPLTIGKTWTVETRSRVSPQPGTGTLVQSVSATVRRWERITVPAGVFTALRVDAAINWRNTDFASVWGNSAETFWYATNVRNAVLQHRVDYPHGGIQSNNVVTELQSFKAAAR
jgi:hypothetical protein